MKPQTVTKILQSISNVFHPLLMLTYSAIIIVYFSQLRYLLSGEGIVSMVIVGEVLFFTCLLPMLFISILYKMKVVGHWALRDRKDRAIPLLINALSYMLCTYALAQQGFPSWVVALYIGASALATVCWAVSFWWKISAHASGLAGLTVISFVVHSRCPELLPIWVPLLSLVTTGFVSSIRVYLGRHTLGQVTVGALSGFFLMTISYILFR